MKKIILGLSALTFIACGKAQEDKNLDFQGKLTPVPAQSMCQGSTPAGYSVYGRTWIVDYTSDNGLGVEDEVKVEPNAYTVIRTCTYGSNQVSVLARVNASVSASSIQTLSNDNPPERKIQVGNTEQSCSLAIQAAKIINYTFSGPCLQTVSDGTSLTLSPR